MVNDKIDKFIVGVAKIESWVRLVWLGMTSELRLEAWLASWLLRSPFGP
jgi:hypothetical protein